ncbi:MAG: hypothetical protein GY839_07300 [candidate division Zixibacteria bacterium]|nr:hypothetical protein [candidate division Zixibacteria bacterium]
MNNIVYKININKAANRLDQFEQKQKQRRRFLLGLFFVILIGVAGVSAFYTMKTQEKIKGYQAELANIEAEIERLSASSQFLSPEDIFALAELANTRMTWTEKFKVLGEILPKDISITEIYYDYQIRTLKIKGISRVNPNMKDLDLVVSIVNVIKGNDNFSKDFVDIKFSSSTRLKHRGQDIIEFEIDCLVG